MFGAHARHKQPLGLRGTKKCFLGDFTFWPDRAGEEQREGQKRGRRPSDGVGISNVALFLQRTSINQLCLIKCALPPPRRHPAAETEYVPPARMMVTYTLRLPCNVHRGCPSLTGPNRWASMTCGHTAKAAGGLLRRQPSLGDWQSVKLRCASAVSQVQIQPVKSLLCVRHGDSSLVKC